MKVTFFLNSVQKKQTKKVFTGRFLMIPERSQRVARLISPRARPTAIKVYEMSDNSQGYGYPYSCITNDILLSVSSKYDDISDYDNNYIDDEYSNQLLNDKPINDYVVNKQLDNNNHTGITPDLSDMQIETCNRDSAVNQIDLVKKVKDRDDFISYCIANVRQEQVAKRLQEQYELLQKGDGKLNFMYSSLLI